MNLLAAKLYDPSVAVSKATSSLLAMTALDTTNLRVAVTVPAHGMLHFVIKCAMEGATTFPQILLGVLNGATVIGRVTPQVTINGTALATSRLACWAEFTAVGLTPGAMNCDAAYGVEILLAATNIKYGGPNDTTTDNAWGAFAFEVYDPQPLPIAANGAANGLQICGSCAATTYATLTSTGAFTVNGVADVSQTGDSFAICKSGGTGDNAAIKTKTDFLPSATAGAAGGVFIAGTNAATAITTGLTAHIIGTVDTLTTYTGNTVQTGDSFARIGAAGAGLTAVTGVTLAASQHVIVDSGTVTTLTNLPSIPANWITATGITAAAFNGKGDWLLSSSYTSPPSAATIAGATWDIVLSGHITAGTTGAALNSAGAAADPWATALPGAYGAGTAGKIIGTNLDATVSSRSTYSGGAVASVTGAVGSVTGLTASDVGAIKTTIGVAGAGLTALGDTRIANLDATVSSRTKPADTQAAVTTVTGAVGSVTAQVNANVAQVNGVTIIGDGNVTPFHV